MTALSRSASESYGHEEAGLPRPEHPKPQFKRDEWINLNGQWNFEFDFGLSGLERGWYDSLEQLEKEITVPFAPESELSGIGYKDFIPAVWYGRSFQLPEGWEDKRILLHFGAVDYDCRVWVNGEEAGRHRGGNVSFSFDITDLVKEGKNDLAVYARDDLRSGKQPAGKQSKQFDSYGVFYTRTTGIWGTVWLEGVPKNYLQSTRIVPDLDGGRFLLTPRISSDRDDLVFRAALLEEGEEVAKAEEAAKSGNTVSLELADPHLWSPEDPHLYDLRLELVREGETVDSVSSYAGLRKFHIEGNKFYLNDEPIFLRFVLDQGFYPDGIWTAPSDKALKEDIRRSQAVGFNGARLHEKVFEERFHYWADKLGYLTWGEFPDWGIDIGKPEAIDNHKREWREAVVRDRNHPSIVAWTPFNETDGLARAHPERHAQLVRDVYELTHELDPTRPVNDASGYVHEKTDIFTVHDYDQDPASLEERYKSVDPEKPGEAFVRFPQLSAPYKGEPYVVDEYGGTYWTEEHASKEEREEGREEWGFGKSQEEVEDLIEALTRPLLENPNVAGFTYTELTDVEQEVNGLYSYERELKFDRERLKEIFGGPAAIEEEGESL